MNKKEEAEKKKKEKEAAAAKKKADAAAAKAAKAAAGGTSAPRNHKTVLGQFEDNVARAQKFFNRAQASFRAWLSVHSATAPTDLDVEAAIGAALTSALGASAEISPRLVDLKEALAVLVAKGFKPGTAPRGPKFAVGEIVRLDDEWMPKYAKSGFYKAEELSKLTIVAIGEKEVLTKTAAGREITIRAMAHLEAVPPEESATAT